MTPWFSPKDLLDKLATNVDAAAQGPADESFGKDSMYPFQEEAIAAIENVAVAGQRR
jgi:type I restriction enzyme R subunit|tara:strand:+ start:14408 stop:14578 length:171 start_codon:yes stop_codon:yes gene_type:complete